MSTAEHSTDDNSNSKREAYDRRAQELVGQRLARVRYYEIDYTNGFTNWDSVPELGHELDFGLDLEMVSGEIFSVGWGWEFFQYDVSIRKGSLGNRPEVCREVDVTEEARWQQYVGHEIEKVVVYWSHTGTDYGDYAYSPQHLSIHFSNLSTVYLSSAEYWADKDKIMDISDSLFVAFSETVLRKYRLGPYAEA